MSTITREFTKEQLQQIEAAAKEVLWPVVWSEKKARKHFSEKITPEVVLELARIALASLEAEPVAWIVHARTGDQVTTDGGYVANAEGILGLHSTPLYTAPPAPVSVPDLKELEEILDWILMLPCPTPKATHFAKRLAVVIDTCRAAMLQGADGNSPVIPDGWVACSERLPEGMQTVITSNGFDIGQGWWDGEGWNSFDSHDVVPGAVSHWMPLPAAPH